MWGESVVLIDLFIGTLFIVRDLLSIVKAHGQSHKLNYWGVSHGSVLGKAFIAMFPDRVRHFVLEGVMHVNDYFTRTWIGSTRDSETALLNLFSERVEARFKLCFLTDYESKSTTEDGLMSALVNCRGVVIGKPLLDDHNVSRDYVVSKLKQVLLENLHFPRKFPTATKIADSDLKCDWATVLRFAEGSTTALAAQSGAAWNTAVDTAVPGISCGDSSFRVDYPDDLCTIYRAHLAQSSMAGGLVDSRLVCARCKFSAMKQFDINKFQKINMTSPVLLKRSLRPCHAFELLVGSLGPGAGGDALCGMPCQGPGGRQIHF
ncbi:hypothetical protein NW759_012184 [Fusarium solani]|nr:hypothetical protein NW759_012184 [Fusarium solani]